MDSFEDVTLYFYIACGVTGGCVLILFILVFVLLAKVNRLSANRSNQLNRQVNMMSDFCYTNPTIVPGEELSRRGYSMYNATGHSSADAFAPKDYSGIYHDTRSKF